MQSADFQLTALNLKFCFLTFEQIKKLSDALRFNKTLVKLDLSNNGLTAGVTNYLLDALNVNSYISEVNLHGNNLNDDFAKSFAHLLEINQVLYRVDISSNPISPFGAQLILIALSECNDTLGDLGDLEKSTCMGVRVREELRQVIKLNNSSQDKKQQFLREKVAHTRSSNVDAADHKRGENDDMKGVVTSAQQAEYPLLKPITFTNIVTDDYLDSGVWNIR